MVYRLGIASDHGGRELKTLILAYLEHIDDIEAVDYGIAGDAEVSVDYPDYAGLVASEVSSGKLDKGILICGTGIGMSIVANKFQNVRAALVWGEYTAKMAGEHNDANILCLGGRTLNHHRAVDYVKIWLASRFEGGRHKDRLEKIRIIEKKLNKKQ